MPFANLRAMLDAFDGPRAREWRRLPLRQVLDESNPHRELRTRLAKPIEGLSSFTMGQLVDARVGAAAVYGSAALEALERLLEDHLDRFLDGVSATSPSADDELIACLAAHELGERLADRIELLGDSRVVKAIKRAHRCRTVADVLALDVNGADYPAHQRRTAREAARAYLERSIRNVERARAVAREHAAADARPLPDELSALDAQLAAIRVTRRAARPRGTFVPGEARFVEPSSIVYAEPLDDDEADLLVIDLTGEAPRIAPSGGCKVDVAAIASEASQRRGGCCARPARRATPRSCASRACRGGHARSPPSIAR